MVAGIQTLLLSGCFVDLSSRLPVASVQEADQWATAGLGINAPVQQRPFPQEDPWNTDISGQPLNPNSALLLSNCGASHLYPYFGAPEDGTTPGYSYEVVDSNTPLSPIQFLLAAGSDAGPYPFPTSLPVMGSDQIAITVDRDSGLLYEARGVFPDGNGGWDATAGAIFNLATGAPRADGMLSATASGMPVFPGLIRTDEVLDQQQIRHALAFSCPNPQAAYVSPATADNGSGNLNTDFPPMGMRVRLRADFDFAAAGVTSQSAITILTALQTYGMFLTDVGPAFYLSGTSDAQWNNEDLAQLTAVLYTDLEVVQ
jgi:hypothetical protein